LDATRGAAPTVKQSEPARAYAAMDDEGAGALTSSLSTDSLRCNIRATQVSSEWSILLRIRSLPMKENKTLPRKQEQRDQHQQQQKQQQQQQKNRQAPALKKEQKQETFHEQERIETRMTD
jgi:hypothetical protein